MPLHLPPYRSPESLAVRSGVQVRYDEAVLRRAGGQRVDFEALPGPLRFYTLGRHDDHTLRLTHRSAGVELRVAAEALHGLVASWPGTDIVELLERLMPALCWGCGVPAEMGACADCEPVHVAELRRIAAGVQLVQ